MAATGGFASTAVVALAIDVLGRIDPALLPDDAKAPDYLADAVVSAGQKATVLQHAMSVGGAAPLLCVGGDCARLATLPIFESLLCANSTAGLRAKWLRLERYFHHAHRTRIDVDKQHSWACERYTLSGVPPAPENLVITEADGTTRPAKATDYTAVRWIYTKALQPGKKSSVEYRIVVK